MLRKLMIGLVVALLSAPTARADESDDKLARAERLFNELEYDKAIQVADEVLSSPDVGPAALVEAYRIKGLSLSGDDRIDDAFMVFRRLMAINPRYQLSKDISPRLAAPFYQAAAIAGEEGVVDLAHIEPDSVGQLGGLELACHVKANPYNMIREVRLRYRTPAEELTGELREPMQGKKAKLTFTLPVELSAAALLYHFEALNQHGGVLGRSGSGGQPYRVQVEPGALAAAGTTDSPGDGSGSGGGTVVASGDEPPVSDPQADQAAAAATSPPPDDLRDDSGASGDQPFWKTWWFWTAVGGGVAVITATAVGVAVGTGGSTDYTYQVRAGLGD